MAKCSECGFLAMWNSIHSTFSEAHKHYREHGYLPNEALSMNTGVPACFIQKADLEKEFYSDESLSSIPTTQGKVKALCGRERNCDGFIPWIQGFHPKERQDMKIQDDRIKSERWHAATSLAVAVLGTLFAAGMTYLAATLGADATKESARWQVEMLHKQTEAQLEMTKMQIEAQKEIAKSSPIPQINLTMPLAPTK